MSKNLHLHSKQFKPTTYHSFEEDDTAPIIRLQSTGARATFLFLAVVHDSPARRQELLSHMDLNSEDIGQIVQEIYTLSNVYEMTELPILLRQRLQGDSPFNFALAAASKAESTAVQISKTMRRRKLKDIPLSTRQILEVVAPKYMERLLAFWERRAKKEDQWRLHIASTPITIAVRRRGYTCRVHGTVGPDYPAIQARLDAQLKSHPQQFELGRLVPNIFQLVGCEHIRCREPITELIQNAKRLYSKPDDHI